MPAVACLRVVAGEDVPAQGDELAGLVAKLTSAFLDSRWAWPRRHGRVGAGAFLLADPRATEFDANELRTLASELQVKLFGVEGEGEVSLLLFEGEQEEIMRFASCSNAALHAALNGDGDALPLAGRIRRVTADGIEPVAHPGDPESQGPAAITDVTPEELIDRVQPADQPAPFAMASNAPMVGFHAVFYAPRQNIVGSAVSDGQIGASSLRGIFSNSGHLQGEAARRYDAHCIETALPILAKPFNGLLFFPISFSSIVHRPTRELYLPLLSQLPAAKRAQLATSVYDVPRDPSFTAMSQVAAFLKTYFGFIDLGVTDPGFRVEKLAAGIVNSVTLLITETDAKARLAQVRRFMDNREHYKRQKIWPAVSHIRNRGELDFCIAQRAPFLSGPAVSDMLEAPADSVALGVAEMPLRREGYVPAAKVA